MCSQLIKTTDVLPKTEGKVAMYIEFIPFAQFVPPTCLHTILWFVPLKYNLCGAIHYQYTTSHNAPTM